MRENFRAQGKPIFSASTLHDRLADWLTANILQSNTERKSILINEVTKLHDAC